MAKPRSKIRSELEKELGRDATRLEVDRYKAGKLDIDAALEAETEPYSSCPSMGAVRRHQRAGTLSECERCRDFDSGYRFARRNLDKIDPTTPTEGA